MSREDEVLDAALEARAHGREDLVSDEARALLADLSERSVESVKADSLDLSMLFEQSAPQVDLSALVASALAAAPRPVPADVAPSRRALAVSALVGLVVTAALALTKLRALPSVAEFMALGHGLRALFLAANHWVTAVIPLGWTGLALACALISVLLAWPLARLASTPARPSGARESVLPGAVALLFVVGLAGAAGPAYALDVDADFSDLSATVSVDLDAVPASQALRVAAESVGLGLVARLPDDPVVTVHVRDVGLDTVLVAILGDANVRVRREANVLIVTPAAAPTDAAPAQTPPAAERAARPMIPAIPSASATTSRERVSFGSDVHVLPGEVVRSVATFGGDVRVEGEVLRDVASMGGDVEVAPSGHVRGDVVSMGGDIEVEPGGVVDGDIVPMGGDVVSSAGGEPKASPRLSIRLGLNHGVRGWFSSALSSAADFGILFLLGLLLQGVARVRLRGVQRTIVTEPVRCGVVGLLAFVATTFALIALTITLVGIPAAIVLGVLAPAALYAGVAATASVLGAALPLPALKGRPILGLAAGVALLYVASLVPIVGRLFLFGVAAVGFGAVVRSRFGKLEAD